MSGSPVRGADYPQSPTLAELLQDPDGSAELDDDAEGAWSAALGGCPVLIASSVRKARLMLMQALDIGPDTTVRLPVCATRELAHTLDRAGAAQSSDIREPADVDWRQPTRGFEPVPSDPSPVAVIDCADTLPDPMAKWPDAFDGSVMLFGLHCPAESDQAGALLLFDPRSSRSMGLYDRLRALSSAAAPVPGAIRQLRRLQGGGGLANRQQSVLQAVRTGITAAAGLAVLEPVPGVLPHDVAFEIPSEVDSATFAAYTRAELTPFTTLIDLAPPNYRVIRGQVRASTLEQFTRIALIPCGPDFTGEEIAHAVLGPVKTADYLGVRWLIDPAQAAWYADEMTRRYGTGHDAYRPVFDLSRVSSQVAGENSIEITPSPGSAATIPAEAE